MYKIFFWNKGELRSEVYPDKESAGRSLYERHRDPDCYALGILEPAGRMVVVDHQNPLYPQESYRNEQALRKYIPELKVCVVKTFSVIVGKEWANRNPFPPYRY